MALKKKDWINGGPEGYPHGLCNLTKMLKKYKTRTNSVQKRRGCPLCQSLLKEGTEATKNSIKQEGHL